jgi:ABC-type antimicrobial peptide transport system permease subunit
MRHTNRIELLIGDFTHAGRMLWKSPIFAATAAVTLALGIGAGTAIFSLTNAVLLRPLPYRNPAMTLLFFLVAGVASWVPAARAAGLDVNEALREE